MGRHRYFARPARGRSHRGRDAAETAEARASPRRPVGASPPVRHRPRSRWRRSADGLTTWPRSRTGIVPAPRPRGEHRSPSCASIRPTEVAVGPPATSRRAHSRRPSGSWRVRRRSHLSRARRRRVVLAADRDERIESANAGPGARLSRPVANESTSRFGEGADGPLNSAAHERAEHPRPGPPRRQRLPATRSCRRSRRKIVGSSLARIGRASLRAFRGQTHGRSTHAGAAAGRRWCWHAGPARRGVI